MKWLGDVSLLRIGLVFAAVALLIGGVALYLRPGASGIMAVVGAVAIGVLLFGDVIAWAVWKLFRKGRTTTSD